MRGCQSVILTIQLSELEAIQNLDIWCPKMETFWNGINLGRIVLFPQGFAQGRAGLLHQR